MLKMVSLYIAKVDMTVLLLLAVVQVSTLQKSLLSWLAKLVRYGILKMLEIGGRVQMQMQLHRLLPSPQLLALVPKLAAQASSPIRKRMKRR